MPPINDAERKYIVYKSVREYINEANKDIRPGSAEYDDLMANIEGQVQRVLRDHQE